MRKIEGKGLRLRVWTSALIALGIGANAGGLAKPPLPPPPPPIRLQLPDLRAQWGQLEPGLENLVAFARLLGYVRYFHPSDQAAAADPADWERFAISSLADGAVERAATPEELARVLQERFAPLAAVALAWNVFQHTPIQPGRRPGRPDLRRGGGPSFGLRPGDVVMRVEGRPVEEALVEHVEHEALTLGHPSVT